MSVYMKVRKTRFTIPKLLCDCRSTQVYPEEGYEMVYRCAACNKVGSRYEFVELK